MPQVAEVAAAFERRQRQTASATATAAMSRWNRIDADGILDSWNELLPGVAGITAAGQLTAAEAGAAYTPSVIRAQGVTPNLAGEVNPLAFATIASDGRPLDTLLAMPAVKTTGRIGRGMGPDEALAMGRRELGMFVATQVIDAGRQAASVGMVADPQVGGYRRQITPPACDRCAIQAGKWFRWNEGFERHPACQCVHVPAVGGKDATAGMPTFDPEAYFDSLDPAEQDRLFTKGSAQAIRDGADMNQVVNARRGMKSTQAYGFTISTTHIGTSTRASAARIMERELGAQFGTQRQRDRLRRVNVPRLMPEQIYADARNREDAIRLLGRFGYLGGDAPRMQPTRIVR